MTNFKDFIDNATVAELKEYTASHKVYAAVYESTNYYENDICEDIADAIDMARTSWNMLSSREQKKYHHYTAIVNFYLESIDDSCIDERYWDVFSQIDFDPCRGFDSDYVLALEDALDHRHDEELYGYFCDMYSHPDVDFILTYDVKKQWFRLIDEDWDTMSPSEISIITRKGAPCNPIMDWWFEDYDFSKFFEYFKIPETLIDDFRGDEDAPKERYQFIEEICDYFGIQEEGHMESGVWVDGCNDWYEDEMREALYECWNYNGGEDEWRDEIYTEIMRREEGAI